MSYVKEIVGVIIVCVVWSCLCFWAGVLYNGRADGCVGDRSSQYEQQQQQLAEVVAEAEAEFYDGVGQLEQEIYISTTTAGKLQEVLSQIRKQKVDL